MKRRRIKVLGIAALTSLLVFSFFGSGSAESLSVNITSGTVVTNDDMTDARILLGISLPQELTGMEIVFAELSVPILATIPDSTALEVYCRPLVMSWDPRTICWEDLGDSLTNEVVADWGTVFATANHEGQQAYFDVTEIVKPWVDETLDNYGLLLFCDSDLLARFESNSNEEEFIGQINFSYTR